MLIVVSILLLLIKLGVIFFSAELSVNIDEYVQVYDPLKGINKSSIFLFLGLNNKLFIKNSLNLTAKNTNYKFDCKNKEHKSQPLTKLIQSLNVRQAIEGKLYRILILTILKMVFFIKLSKLLKYI